MSSVVTTGVAEDGGVSVVSRGVDSALIAKVSVEEARKTTPVPSSSRDADWAGL
jgi:asparagine synthetase B (glutamine-hydrolysing)